MTVSSASNPGRRLFSLRLENRWPLLLPTIALQEQEDYCIELSTLTIDRCCRCLPSAFFMVKWSNTFLSSAPRDIGARCSLHDGHFAHLLPMPCLSVRLCSRVRCLGGGWRRRGKPRVRFEWPLRYGGVAILHGSGLRDEQGVQVSPRQGLRRRAS